MKTIIASGQNGTYHEVSLNALPKSWSTGWPEVLRGHLVERLAGLGLLKDVRLSKDGILHVDLKPCTEGQRKSFFESLLVALYELGIHDRDQGAEYCVLKPGTGKA